MSFDLILKPTCSGCGSTTDLYGSNCKHLTLCPSCGKTMAENRAKCYECGSIVTRLIREYNVRASTSGDKNYFIGRFVTGLPNFSKKKTAENRWSAHKEGLQGRQVTDALREKYKNKPWLLEDETGQSQYHGPLEGSQSATYYLLMLQGKEFVAIPAGSWYNFNKVAQYKQLTLEEAEEKMKNRKKTADGYERWMMKAANNGAAAFGEVERPGEKETVGGGRGRKKTSGNDDEANVSDRGEEDEEEAARKSRLGINKRSGDDDEEGPRGGDLDLEDDDIEKGDDWEHEETFTDDDEAVGNDPEEREELAPEAPPPPEIKDEEEDEDEANEEEGGLSKSGKELKKLLGRSGGLNDSDADDDDDDDDDDEDEVGLSPVLVPRQREAPKEGPAEESPAKPVPSASSKGTPPTSKSSKGKRKLNGDDAKASNGAPPKKVKPETVKPEPEAKSGTKEDSTAVSKSSASSKATTPADSNPSSTSSTVTEEELRAFLMQKAPITTQELVNNFKARLRGPEEKKAFADKMRKISRIQKTNGSNYVVVRDK